MKRLFYFVGVLVSALLLIGFVMGGLFFLLIWIPEQGSTESAKISCPEGQNSYMCIIQSYLHPKEPEGI